MATKLNYLAAFAITVLICSCGNGTTEKTMTTDSTSATTSTIMNPAPAPAVVDSAVVAPAIKTIESKMEMKEEIHSIKKKSDRKTEEVVIPTTPGDVPKPHP